MTEEKKITAGSSGRAEDNGDRHRKTGSSVAVRGGEGEEL